MSKEKSAPSKEYVTGAKFYEENIGTEEGRKKIARRMNSPRPVRVVKKELNRKEEKTVLGISRSELKKERYDILVRGLNLALADIGSEIRVSDVSDDSVDLSLEFSRHGGTGTDSDRETDLRNVVASNIAKSLA